MNNDFIQTVAIRDFGCIKQASLQLSALHALIGPNDSGKTTVLRAIRTVLQLGGGMFEGGPGNWRPFDPATSVLWARGAIDITYPDGAVYTVASDVHGNVSERVRKAKDKHADSRALNHPGMVHKDTQASLAKKALQPRLLPATMVRFHPEELRKSTALTTDDEPLRLSNERGTGLAAIYDAILIRNLDGFLQIRAEVRRLFPWVLDVGFRNVSKETKELRVRLKDDRWVGAAFFSEGLLYYLAFAALPYLSPSKMVLIEEPENGLHPARVAEVMRILREVSNHTQVVIATHSPLVINELQGHEVSVITRTTEEGTKATLIRDTPRFEERSKVYALGELWLSYSNGEDEGPLIQGEPRS